MRSRLVLALALGLASSTPRPLEAAPQTDHVNFEAPHVRPLALTPDGSKLLAVNTADGRLEVFDATGASLRPLFDVPVGLEPVSVRAPSNERAWVVNHVSDSVSVVDLRAGTVVATLRTDDEPADIVFAGEPERAFVSCSQANTVLVYDAADPGREPTRIHIAGEEPRAMALSRDGRRVYVAIFQSGNDSTVLGGGLSAVGEAVGIFPPNVVSDPTGPHGGTNPPPNGPNGAFVPPIDASLPPPPAVSLIVKQDRLGRWLDDTGADWTELVSGSRASASGRPVGWDVIDHDVAVIDVETGQVGYVDRLMNVCMAIAVNPATGRLFVVGTEASNEVRFEPVLRGRFARVLLARLGAPGPGRLTTASIEDLNPHVAGAVTIDPAERASSIGDPRGIAWRAHGRVGYVTGMGSNNVVVVDGEGRRHPDHDPIEVGEGPTGVVVQEERERAFVLNKFESSISVIDTRSSIEVQRSSFHSPEPEAIASGRRHLYDTHRNSGNGALSCATCHVDARMDGLAWDLGDPSGEMKDPQGQNLAANGNPGIPGFFLPWHPMKGPMTTLTLVDIIGHEPLHWRGDRDGIEEFNGAFTGLLARDAQLTPAEMQEFEDFLETIHFPPNPFRTLDNGLPSQLPLPGHFETHVNGTPGRPLPVGNANRGLVLFSPPNELAGVACRGCHTLTTGTGPDFELSPNLVYQPIATGPDGEHHHMLVPRAVFTNRTLKVPQLRNGYEKVGFETTQLRSRSGFGFRQDGTVDSLSRFVSRFVDAPQDVADLVAFLLAFSGSDLPPGVVTDLQKPPGTPSRDAHAAVGVQVTIGGRGTTSALELGLLTDLLALARSGAVGLVARGLVDGERRGFYFERPTGRFRSDRSAQSMSVTELLDRAGPGAEQTFTAVPFEARVRIGVDRDADGVFDQDELDAGTDPADANSPPPFGPPAPARAAAPPKRRAPRTHGGH